MHRSHMILAAAVTLCSSSLAAAAPLSINFDFGTPASPTLAPVNSTPTPGVTVSNITAGPFAGLELELTPSNVASYNATAPILTVDATSKVVNSLDAAEAEGVYFAFTITADPGVEFSLDALSLDVGRSAASSTRNWGFYTDVTGFTAPVASDTVTATRGDASPETDTATLSGLSGLTGSLEVRFYVNPGTGGFCQPWPGGRFRQHLDHRHRRRHPRTRVGRPARHRWPDPARPPEPRLIIPQNPSSAGRCHTHRTGRFFAPRSTPSVMQGSPHEPCRRMT